MNVKIAPSERLDDLQLKGYKIIQDPEMFCFGIDAVLLATFARVKNNDKVVDLCTGNGIIPLLLAGKTEASHISGVEIQDKNVDLASRSVLLNDLENRINIIQGDVKTLPQSLFNYKCNVVTVNPPYMIGNHGLANENDSKKIARHEVLCTLDNIVESSANLLCDKGRFYMIHRPFRLAEIFATMMKYKLEPKSMQLVHSSVDKEPSMVLIEGIKGAKSRITVHKPLIIYNEDGSYTDEILLWYGEMKQ